MRSLALLLGCAALGWWIITEYRRATREAQQREVLEAADAQIQADRQRALQVRANLQRFLTDLYADVEVEVSEFGVFVGSCDVAVVAEVVASSPAFRGRAA